ncbi:hypothetical protein [Natrinema marinum]|nr:hypothetical protein [Natrinema marinum]
MSTEAVGRPRRPDSVDSALATRESADGRTGRYRREDTFLITGLTVTD